MAMTTARPSAKSLFLIFPSPLFPGLFDQRRFFKLLGQWESNFDFFPITSSEIIPINPMGRV
jgi:hypothetical protein